MLCSEILNNLDVFGVKVNFAVMGKEKHQTPLGGVCTIIATGLLCVLIFKGFKDLINGASYNVEIRPFINGDPPITILNQSSFMVGVKVENPLTNNTLY